MSDPFGAGQPDAVEPDDPGKWEFWQLPRNYTFREWSNYWRQFTRRCFIRKEGGTYRSDRSHLGKKLTRAIKRAKVRAMKDAGHFKGDNRPVPFRPAAEA